MLLYKTNWQFCIFGQSYRQQISPSLLKEVNNEWVKGSLRFGILAIGGICDKNGANGDPLAVTGANEAIRANEAIEGEDTISANITIMSPQFCHEVTIHDAIGAIFFIGIIVAIAVRLLRLALLSPLVSSANVAILVTIGAINFCWIFQPLHRHEMAPMEPLKWHLHWSPMVIIIFANGHIYWHPLQWRHWIRPLAPLKWWQWCP